MRQAAFRFRRAASCASTASPLPNRSRRKRLRSEGLSSSRQTEVCRSPIGRRRMRNYFPSQRSELRLDLRRSKLRLDIALPSPLLMRRSACCESLPQTLRPAEYPRRRALPGPVRRVRSSSLMTAPASGPADKSSGLLQLFSPPLHLTALPWKRCKQRLHGYAAQWGRFGRLVRLSPTELAFATLVRLRRL